MEAEWKPNENAGQWLHFFYKEGRTRIPARISRSALETCFHSAAGESLVNIYVAHAEVVHEQVRLRLRAGERGTAHSPLSLGAQDFEERRRAMSANLVPSQMIEETAQELGDKFTADELEAVASWMRQRTVSSSRR